MLKICFLLYNLNNIHKNPICFSMIYILLFFVLLSPLNSLSFLSNPPSYNESKAREFWYYQVMSECNIDRIQNWNVPPVSSIYPSITDIHIIHNYTETGANLAYLAYNTQTNLIFLSVRGSHNNTNNWEDADFIRISYEKCDDCSVHQGFYHAYLDLKDEILSRYMILSKKYPTAQTAIFGHSLGGAIASFAFIDLKEFMEINYFYSFGSPRVGNQKFAEFCNGKLENSNTARVTHFKDNVPHLPFSFLGFQHIDGEIFYANEESSQFIVCKREGEDPSCSTQYYFVQTQGDDHGKYMNFPMNDFTPACQ